MKAESMLNYSNKIEFYHELTSEVEGMLERPWFTNLSTVAAEIMLHLPCINWVGFYLTDQTGLILGPFQGQPACLRIPNGKGVCGKAAHERSVVIVPDIEKFPGHIVCDVRSQSEIALPLVLGDRLLGVLDIDSPEKNRFDQDDQAGLSKIVELVVHGSWWPNDFSN